MGSHAPGYALRRAARADEDALLALLSLPAVCEFLSDGAPPPRALVAEWISAANAAGDGPLGLWLLVEPPRPREILGCVRLSEVADGVASAELTYVLRPDVRGRGLAIAMSRSALARAFATGRCESVLAGADGGNAPSIEVMKRLGMRLLREVAYPLGAGVEYVISREAFAAQPAGELLAFRE